MRETNRRIPPTRPGRDPIHPWDSIAEWAGWKKGRVALHTDSEVAEMYGVQRHWVSIQRCRRGALRLRRTKRSWSQEDFDYIAEACATVGRTPWGFVTELRRRSGNHDGRRRKRR